ncbi:hypothetical protein RIF29_22857 [Crotalaria pallida]|uniref:Uncharacterized protein n=1 Tax=Crotalaria pallida TaxID=3830 RepID=A0AAN9F9U1_CROPI
MRRNVRETTHISLEYCNKVYSAKAKYYGTEGAESKPRSRPCDGAKFRSWNPILRMDAHANIHVKNDTKILNQIKKSIRVLRVAADTKLTKTIEDCSVPDV